MADTIKLSWFRGDGRKKPNFGDDLSPFLVRAITGRRVEFAPLSACELLAVGSNLQAMVKTRYRLGQKWRQWMGKKPITIWGAGILEPLALKADQLNILALRGTSTKACFGTLPAMPLGDPGLLARHYFQKASSKGLIGIVPHYVEKAAPLVQMLSKDSHYKVIDVEQKAEVTIADIAQCDWVLSSSLHGLIVADAMEIPNRHISFGHGLHGGDFKFWDYASAIGRKDIAANRVQTQADIDQAMKILRETPEMITPAILDTITADLAKALKSTF